MKKLKLISAVLAVIMLFGGCGDSSAEADSPTGGAAIAEDDRTEEPTTLRIPFDYSEGVSPYTTASRSNRYVCGLIYRSMVNLTSDYNYELDLVSEIYTEDNTVWYIYLYDSMEFSDGTEFTAYDLRYSMQLAMASGSYYANSLDMVSSVTVVNATCLRVTLLYANRYFANLLTFPVISYDTVSRPLYFPGRYSMSEDGTYLTCNSNGSVSTIELVSIADQELLTYEMRLGKYDCIYNGDPASLGTSSVGGVLGLQSNRMVYLGLNSSSSFTYYADFRKAVAAAIDYDALCSGAFGQYASAPRGVYNADFYEVQYTSKRSVDLMSANLLLDGMGFTSKDREGFRLNSRGSRISLTLVVCNESSTKVAAANAIADMLAQVGIEVVVSSVSYSSYMVALETYNYDMYIAEVKLDVDMDLTKFLTPTAYQLSEINYLTYGMPQSESLYFSWLSFSAGTSSASEFISAFNEVMPYVPLCYTKGSVIFSRNLSFSPSGTDFDMFYDILDW